MSYVSYDDDLEMSLMRVSTALTVTSIGVGFGAISIIDRRDTVSSSNSSSVKLTITSLALTFVYVPVHLFSLKNVVNFAIRNSLVSYNI